MRPINQPTSLPDGPAPKVLLADKGYDEITPIYPMDLDDRIEAMKRVGRECGMGRHGANDNTAPPLQFLKSGVWTAKAQDWKLRTTSTCQAVNTATVKAGAAPRLAIVCGASLQ